MSIDHKRVAEMFHKLPAFPESVNQVLQLTAQKDSSPQDLVSVIERDMVMTARVLRLVNSPLFRLEREVISVQHAVVYVGMDLIKNLAISIATAGCLPKSNKAGLDMDEFWLQSLSVGVIAKLLARRRGISEFDSADYFVSGLLHNIGKIVFAHFYPEDYAKVLSRALEADKADYEIETDIFGFDHSELGSMLAEDWKLPEQLVSAIRNHHSDFHKSDDAESNSELSMSVFCASQIFHRLNAKSKEIRNIPTSVSVWLGNDIDTLIDDLGDIEEEIDRAMMFIQR
jgi:HD-like signal output (HDOD) protein